MTQLLPSASGGQPQAPRNVLRPGLWCVLITVFTLVCLLVLMTGTSEAGGRRGGGRSFSGRRASPTRSHRHNYGHKHRPRHKHKHKRMRGAGGDGGGDSGGGDSGGGDSGGGEEDAGQGSGGAAGTEVAQGPGGAVDSEKAAGARYGMEITTLYKGTAAEEGLGIGDIILQVNGTPTPDFEALVQALAKAGGRAEVLALRGDNDDGKPETVTLFPQKGIIGVSVERVRVD